MVGLGYEPMDIDRCARPDHKQKCRQTEEAKDEVQPVLKKAKTDNLPIQAYLPDEIFLQIEDFCDTASLCALDTTAKFLLDLNTFRGNTGDLAPWYSRGMQRFHGMEIEGEIFDTPACCSNRGPVNYKRRYSDFNRRVLKFEKDCPAARNYSEGQEIELTAPDHVAYFNASIRLDQAKDKGVFMEINVNINADNLSLAVVDFDAGGRSSVTFSPDTGAVIKEQKIQERPRKVKGWYVQPLRHIGPIDNTEEETAAAEAAILEHIAAHGVPAADGAEHIIPFSFSRGEKFEGKIGIYVADEKIAFFRRVAKRDPEWEWVDEWESTGFVVGTDWVYGNKITPCLAFRDEGAYQVEIAAVKSEPPFYPKNHDNAWTKDNYESKRWPSINDHRIRTGELPDHLLQHHNENAIPPPPQWHEVEIEA